MQISLFDPKPSLSEVKFNAALEEISFDLWVNEIEEAAAYRSLVAQYRSRIN
jgi:hypothetical protein